MDPATQDPAAAPPQEPRPEVSLGLAHAAPVTSVAFSFDGRWVLSQSRGREGKIWDVRTGREVRSLRWHGDTIARSAAPLWALAGILLWDMETRTRLASFLQCTSEQSRQQQRRGEVTTYAANGRWGLSGSGSPSDPSAPSADRALSLWDAATGETIRAFAGRFVGITSAAFSPDSELAVTGNVDGTLTLWDVGEARELRTFPSGHADAITSVDFFSDGRSVLSGSRDGTMKLWDVTTGTEIRAFAGHTGPVTSVNYAPDGRQAASTSDDGTVKLWDVGSGEVLRTLSGHTDAVLSAAFSLDGRWLASGSRDQSVKLWELAQVEERPVELRMFSVPGGGDRRVSFSPDGRWLLTAGGASRGRMTLWDVSGGDAVRSYKGLQYRDPSTGERRWHDGAHGGSVTDAAFSPDGEHIVSGGEDGVVRVWKVSEEQEVRTLVHTDLAPLHEEAIKSDHQLVEEWSRQGHHPPPRPPLPNTRVFVACAPDGRRAASADFLTGVKVWEVPSGRELQAFSDFKNVSTLAFSPDGHSLLLGSHDNTLKIIDAVSGTVTTVFPLPGGIDPHGSSHDGVLSAVFSADGRHVLSATGDEYVRLWDVATGECVRTFGRDPGKFGSGGVGAHVASVALSPDGRLGLWEGRGDWHPGIEWGECRLFLWNMATGRSVRALGGPPQGTVTSTAFSPDGRLAVSAATDGTMNIWDVAAAARPPIGAGTFGRRAERVTSVAIAADGRWALAGWDRRLVLWDIRHGGLARIFGPHDGAVTAAAFLPDGRRALSASLKELRLWDVVSGTRVTTLAGHESAVRTLAVSPDGARALSSSEDATKLWDLATGTEIRSFAAPAAAARSVAFTPDGHRVVSTDPDGTLRLWDLTSGETIRTFQNEGQRSGMSPGAAVSSDGRRVAWISEGHPTLVLWDTDTGEEIASLPRSHGRPLVGDRFEEIPVSAAFVDQDRQVLSASPTFGTLTLWDLAGAKEGQVVEAHHAALTGMSVTPDGRLAVSASADGTMRLWDVRARTEVALFAVFDDDEWIVMTPDGFHNASQNGAENITVRIGTAVAALADHHGTYARPDIVSARLADAGREEGR